MLKVIKPFEYVPEHFELRVFLGGHIDGYWREKFISLIKNKSICIRHDIAIINPECSDWTKNNIKWEEEAIMMCNVGFFWFTKLEGGKGSIKEIEIFGRKLIFCGSLEYRDDVKKALDICGNTMLRSFEMTFRKMYVTLSYLFFQYEQHQNIQN